MDIEKVLTYVGGGFAVGVLVLIFVALAVFTSGCGDGKCSGDDACNDAGDPPIIVEYCEESCRTCEDKYETFSECVSSCVIIEKSGWGNHEDSDRCEAYR